MFIDFSPVISRQVTILDFASRFSLSELRAGLPGYISFTRQAIDGVTDEQLFQIPEDPEANDPDATAEADRHMGWSLAHLVLHVTASAEEGAAFSSILARGIPIGGRLRYEPDWRQVQIRAEIVQRLEECQAICHGYLATWPAAPHLDTLRIMPEKLSWLKSNAPAAYLGGLLHWHRHLEQFQKVAAQVAGVEISLDPPAPAALAGPTA